MDDNADNEELFKLVVASVRDYAIFVVDPSGVVATWNTGAERIKGYTAHEIVGKHISTFYTPEDAATGKAQHELDTATREGRFEDEGWRVRRDGTRFWANVVLTAMRDASGRLVGFAKITRDLTDRIRAEEERAGRLAAEQASQVKDEFLAMLGHELRNPLAPIVTALDLMRRRDDAASSKERAVIERQVEHMRHLVDDLLDVARVTRGKVTLWRQPIDAREVLAKAIELAQPAIAQRGHQLTFAPVPRPLLVDGDEARLVQTFSNLLTNAAKYTPPGGAIEVVARAERGDVVVDVRDNGAGIEPELLPRVFDLFVQGYQSPERAAGGLGLGLTLVKRLVELHGGAVEARSEGVGQGSTFTVQLPALSESDAGDALERMRTGVHVAVGPHRRVLLVDDNEDARELLAELLSAAGHEVRTAPDAASALDLVRTFAPEVGVLDIGLPVMDGYELASRLRVALGAATPRLIALTGYGQPGDQERSQAAGFAVHLVKPVDPRRLLDAISKV